MESREQNVTILYEKAQGIDREKTIQNFGDALTTSQFGCTLVGVRGCAPRTPARRRKSLPPWKPLLHVGIILPRRGWGFAPRRPCGVFSVLPNSRHEKSRGGALPQVARQDLIILMAIIFNMAGREPARGGRRGVFALPSEMIT